MGNETSTDIKLREHDKKLNFIIWLLLGFKAPIGLGAYVVLKTAFDNCDNFSIEEVLDKYGELDFMEHFKDFKNIV